MTLNKIQKSILEMLADKPMTAKDVGDELLRTGHRPTDVTGAARNCSIMANQGLLTKKKAIDERVHEPRTFYSTSPEGLSVIGRFPKKELTPVDKPVKTNQPAKPIDKTPGRPGAITRYEIQAEDGTVMAIDTDYIKAQQIAQDLVVNKMVSVSIQMVTSSPMCKFKPVVKAELVPAA